MFEDLIKALAEARIAAREKNQCIYLTLEEVRPKGILLKKVWRMYDYFSDQVAYIEIGPLGEVDMGYEHEWRN